MRLCVLQVDVIRKVHADGVGRTSGKALLCYYYQQPTVRYTHPRFVEVLDAQILRYLFLFGSWIPNRADRKSPLPYPGGGIYPEVGFRLRTLAWGSAHLMLRPPSLWVKRREKPPGCGQPGGKDCLNDLRVAMLRARRGWVKGKLPPLSADRGRPSFLFLGLLLIPLVRS